MLLVDKGCKMYFSNVFLYLIASVDVSNAIHKNCVIIYTPKSLDTKYTHHIPRLDQVTRYLQK